MGKTKTRKGRGQRTHGRGRKGGRGKGLRGGKGNAGLHKHKYATTVIKEAMGIQMFGHRGFKRPAGASLYDVVINVGDVAERFPGQATVDLGQHGFTKLLGGGAIAAPVTIKVDAASAGALAKVQKAGGKVETSRVKAEPKPKTQAKPAPPAPKKEAPKKDGPKKDGPKKEAAPAAAQPPGAAPQPPA